MEIIKFYNEVDCHLKPFIHHYWYIDGHEAESGAGDLLPMDHVDMIISSKPMYDYIIQDERVTAATVHFHGLRLSSVRVIPKSRIRAIGISFHPWGFAKFIRQPMNLFVNRVVDLAQFHKSLPDQLAEALSEDTSMSSIIQTVESLLVPYFIIDEKLMDDHSIIRNFIDQKPENITDYCLSHGISNRQLERLFLKYIGVSPKAFNNIKQFEKSSRSLLYEYKESLTNITYDSGYYDQSHFVRYFKRYTGYTPKKFKLKKPALKSKLYKNE